MQAYDGELGAAVARAQDGDEAAFAVAYRLVQPGLLGYLRGIVGDDAEDVASDAWLEIARDLGRFKGDGAGFRGWTRDHRPAPGPGPSAAPAGRPRAAALEQDLLELPGPHSTQDQALEALSTEQALELVARAAAGPGRGRSAARGRRPRRPRRRPRPRQTPRRGAYRRPPGTEATRPALAERGCDG